MNLTENNIALENGKKKISKEGNNSCNIYNGNNKGENNVIIWDVEAQFSLSKEDAKPGIDAAIQYSKLHFQNHPMDTIVLQFKEGTYIFQGNKTNISIRGGDRNNDNDNDATDDDDDDSNGKKKDGSGGGSLIIKGVGMRKTKFMTQDPIARTIDIRNYKNVKFQGIHFARNYITVSQGDVIDVGKNKISVQLHYGYPNPIELAKIPGKDDYQGKYLRRYYYGFNNNPNTEIKKADGEVVVEILNNDVVPMVDLGGDENNDDDNGNSNDQIAWDMHKSIYDPSKNIVHFALRGPNAKTHTIQIGEMLGIKVKHGGNPYFVIHTENITFDNCLWTHQSRGVIRGKTKNIRFSDCRIERTMPPTTTEEEENSSNKLLPPFLATPGGGPQIGQPKDPIITGIVVENCYFESSGDDNLAIFNGIRPIIRNVTTKSAFARSILLHDCENPILENNQVVNGIIEYQYSVKQDEEDNEVLPVRKEEKGTRNTKTNNNERYEL